MRYRRIPHDTNVHELGRRIDLPGGPTAVLALHGWTGWPGRLAYLAERLNQAGFTVSVPRLPGHGTNMQDMLQTRAADWIRCAVDEYLDLCERHERVFLVGASMGAVLASMIAAHFDVERVALLAPAFTNRKADRAIKTLRRLPVRGAEERRANPRLVDRGKSEGLREH
mgnify:CR=1 FL=1